MKNCLIVGIGFLFVASVSSYGQQNTGSRAPRGSAQVAFENKDIEKLTELLLDESYWTRSQAASRIAKLARRRVSGVEKAVPNLIHLMLTDEDDEASTNACRALVRIGGTQATEGLVEAVKVGESMHPFVRVYAFQELARSEDERVEDPAIEALDDTCYHVRMAAAMALGTVRSEKAIEPLLHHLVSYYQSLECADDKVLGGLAPAPFGAQLSATLRQIGKPAVPKLFDLLEHSCQGLRRSVAVTLGFLGERRAVPSLMNVVENGQNPSQRETAVLILGDFQDTRAIPLLIQALGDTTTYTGGCVINPLSRPIAYAAYRALLGMDVKVRRIHRKGKHDLFQVVDGSASDPALVEALSSRIKRRRYKAALELGSMFYKGAVPVLMEMVTSADDWKDRLWAARYLGLMKDKRAIPALKKALDDEYSPADQHGYRPIASEAHSALQHMGVGVEIVGDPKKKPRKYRVIEDNNAE